MGKRSFKKAFKAQDEYFTPSILVNMLVPYLRKWEIDFVNENGYRPLIWLPFDTEESKYYTILKEQGFHVVRSHLNDDKDFFNWQPNQFDLIVSNPPFSTKDKIFTRCIYELKRPFVLLMNMMAINYQNISGIFSAVNPKIQFIIPDKKVSFDGNTSSFCSGYVCYDFIDHTDFIHLYHNNTKNNFSK